MAGDITDVHSVEGTSPIWLIFSVMRSAQSITLAGFAMPGGTMSKRGHQSSLPPDEAVVLPRPFPNPAEQAARQLVKELSSAGDNGNEKSAIPPSSSAGDRSL